MYLNAQYNLYTIQFAFSPFYNTNMKLRSFSTTSVHIWTDACVLFKHNKFPHKAGIGIFIQVADDQFALSSPLHDLNPINSTNAELCAIHRSFQIIHTNQFRNTHIWTDSQHAITLCHKWSEPSYNLSISNMHHQIKHIKHPFMIPIYYLYTQLLRDGIRIKINHINNYTSYTNNNIPHISHVSNLISYEHRIAHNLARKGAERSYPFHLREQ